MSTRTRITALLVTAPLLVVFGALGTGFAWLSDGLSQYNDPAATTAQYGVALLIGLSGAIALLVVSRSSEPTRLRRAGTITGAALVGLAVLVSGVPFAVSTGGLVHRAVLSAQPLTDEEHTPIIEIQARADELFDGIGLSDGESMSSYYGCGLSNLDQGQQLSSLEVFHLQPEDREDAIEAIRTRWQSLGYDVRGSAHYLSATGSGVIDTATVSWYAETGALSIDVTSICVVKDERAS